MTAVTCRHAGCEIGGGLGQGRRRARICLLHRRGGECVVAGGSPTITAPFWKWVERMATRIGFEQAGKQVFLGDGAAWIWKMAEELFPQAIQELDHYHGWERSGMSWSTISRTRKSRRTSFSYSRSG
ncbi:MAG: hypothetical protein OXC80_14815 [Gammaproteobacteria bacterium]|nr:hypothetical protein [Gammaproteobacteria bacterium]